VSYSREVQALVRLVRSFGIPHRITDVNGPGHSRTSYHYVRGTGGRGTAIDIAGPLPYAIDQDRAVAAMLVICVLLEPYERHIEELCCSHLDYSIAAGRRVPRYAVADHWDHIHLAVRPGTFLVSADPATEVIVVPDDPNLPNIEGPLQLEVLQDGNGNCTGYAIFSISTGEVHGFGPGWKYYGRSEDLTPD
jgi:hypothetical protein